MDDVVTTFVLGPFILLWMLLAGHIPPQTAPNVVAFITAGAGTIVWGSGLAALRQLLGL